ncbi:Alpha-crystallin A chain [Halotydeus destructor]|nr:Alpha-crystallin A chain [Halotydeus destructor]
MAYRSGFWPRILGQDYWDMYDYPEELLGQDFGLNRDPFDVFEPVNYLLGSDRGYSGGRAVEPYRGRGGHRRGHQGGQQLATYGQQGGLSQVRNDKNQFQVNLDVKHFSPEEVTVKHVDDDSIVVHGKHEEKSDEHGFISREFTRRYVLPKDCEKDKVTCNWGQNGVLSLTCPKTHKVEESGFRTIPINYSGQPQQAIGHGHQSQKMTQEPQRSKQIDQHQEFAHQVPVGQHAQSGHQQGKNAGQVAQQQHQAGQQLNH